MTDWQNKMFHGYLVGRPYMWDIRENQLSPSCLDSSHSSHVLGTCFTSQEAYLRATRENCFSLQLPWVFTLSLLHTTLTNKSHIKYRVHKIEQYYNQIWHWIMILQLYKDKVNLLPKIIIKFYFYFWLNFILGIMIFDPLYEVNFGLISVNS